MKVKEVIAYLEKCNPEALVFLGPISDYNATVMEHITEVGYSDTIVRTVYLY